MIMFELTVDSSSGKHRMVGSKDKYSVDKRR